MLSGVGDTEKDTQKSNLLSLHSVTQLFGIPYLFLGTMTSSRGCVVMGFFAV